MTVFFLTTLVLLLLTLAVRSDNSPRRAGGLWLNGGKQNGWIILRPGNFINRRVGLLNTPVLAPQCGILLKTKSVHMSGMLYPLDLVAIDRQGRVVQIAAAVAPGAVVPRFPKSTRHVLELAAGQGKALALKPGDHLSFGESL